MISLDIQNDYLDCASVLDDKYLIIDTIGYGRYAKVKLALDVEAKQKYAIKIMKNDPTLNLTRLNAFINEVSTQTSIDHKHIIRILQVRLDGQYRKVDGRLSQVAYFVMELADQGELFELIEQTSHFHEKFARSIFQQLIKGIEHLHERGLAHRDIKSENILFSNGTLKLADFGFCAKTIDEHGCKLTFESSNHVGSPEYNPPELHTTPKVKTYYPESADLFAAGVILFSMVIKSAPFKTTKNSDPYYQLLRQDKQSFWQVFSELNQPSQPFRDFIEKLLEENPAKRLTLDQIKKHAWMQGPILNQADYQKELKQRHDVVVNKQRDKIISRRERKFASRKALKRVEQKPAPRSIPQGLVESLEIIENINAKLMVKAPVNEFKQAQPLTVKIETKQDEPILQKQNQKKGQTSRNSEGSKKSSPATPPNDSDN